MLDTSFQPWIDVFINIEEQHNQETKHTHTNFQSNMHVLINIEAR
jgi:hypothetical protein